MVKPGNILYWPPGRYVPAVKTDVAATFARVRAELAKQQQPNVKPLKKRA